MSISDHQMIQHQLFRIKHTELNEIFLVMGMRSFVTAMIGIFVPIYMYTLGFSLRDIFTFQVEIFVFELCFEYMATVVRTLMGPKHAIAFSMPLLIAYFWMLSTIQTFHWPLLFIAFCGGTSLALFWQGYHYDFSLSKHKGGATKDVSRLNIMISVLGAIAPFIGGVVASNFGFNALYGVVIFFLAVVFLPLIKKSETHLPPNLDLRKIKIRDIWRDMVSYGGTGMEGSISLTVWPLFVFSIVKTYQSVGLITSAALILTIFVTWIVGKRVNNSNRHAYIRTSGYLDSLIYILFTLVDTFVQVTFLNFARSLTSALRYAPFVSEYYLHADETSRSEYILIMESAIDIFRIMLFVLLVVATYSFDEKGVLIVGLLLGAFGSLLGVLMPRAKCEMPYCKNEKTIRIIPKLRPSRESS